MIVSFNKTKSIITEFTIYPNPFSFVANISFSINKYGKIVLKLFDFQGGFINTLLDVNKKPGEYTVKWNGNNYEGKEVKSGIYLVRLQVGRNIVTRSIEYIK